MITFPQKNIKVIVAVVKWFYFLGALFSIVALGWFIQINAHDYLIIPLVALMISTSMFIGLHYKKSWVPISMVILSTLNLIQHLVHLSQDITGILLGSIGFLISLFLLFFFTRKEVKEYFNSNETIIY